jgi:hypothetical protein
MFFTDREKSLFEARYIPEPNTGCWLWIGAATNGYGNFKIRDGLTYYAHRLSYMHHVGPIPNGLVLDHKCRVSHCVNPEHLEAVTQGTNVRRGIAASSELHPSAIKNRAKTHCPRGHPYNKTNTYTNSRGQRCCKICKNASNLATAKKRAAE